MLTAFAPNAYAEGEACGRDTECAGVELCQESACTVTESPPPTCDEGCDPEDVCTDGYCKREGVTCDNPAGRCWMMPTFVDGELVNEGHGECECADGNGSGWTAGYNPDDANVLPADDVLLDSCNRILIEDCGSEAPTLSESCQGDVLTTCEAFVGITDTARRACGADIPEATFARLGECCDDYDELEFSEYRECVLDLEDPDCTELTACEPELPDDTSELTEDGGGAETDGDSSDTDDDDSSDTDAASAGQASEGSGCSTGGPPRGSFLFFLLLLPLRRRFARK